MPPTAHFKKWYGNSKRRIVLASGKPQDALEWISKVKNATDWKQMGDDFSSAFSSLHMKIYDGLKEVTNSMIHRKAQMIEDELERTNKFMTGPHGYFGAITNYTTLT